MIKNYLKITFRILRRNSTYVIISLFSLAFAMAFCVFSYVNYDYTTNFDSQYTDVDDIYRLNSSISVNGGSEPWGLVPEPLVNTILNENTYDYSRIIDESAMVKTGGNVFPEKIYYVDKSFFDFFDIPFKTGGYSSMDVNTVVLGHDFSKKLFGEENPVGKHISLIADDGSEEIYDVVGVMEKLPKNSSFHFNVVAQIPVVSRLEDLSDWSSSKKITTFFSIKDSKNIVFLENHMNSFLDNQKETPNQWKVQKLYFQPFKEISKSSDSDFSTFVQGRVLKRNLRGFVVQVPAIMSLFILLITCFNYVNISIALSSKRLMEIGLRKVVGGNRVQLIRQFLLENQIVCFLAAALAIVLLNLLLPTLNSYADLELKIDFFGNVELWVFLLGLPFLTALVSGIYPAFYATSFTPITILRGNLKFGSFGKFTKILLTAQFTFSCLALITGILLTQNAIYQEEVDYGYSMDDIAVVQIANTSEYEIISNQLSLNPNILEFAGTQNHIGFRTRTSMVDMDGREINATVSTIGGEHYLNTMGVTLTQGRHFLPGNGVNLEKSIIVNQAFINQTNLEEPLGKEVLLDSLYYNIVGIVEDYKQNGLHEVVPPCILKKASTDNYKFIAVKSSPENLLHTKAYLEDSWYKVFPNKPYSGFLQTDVVAKERLMNTGIKNIALFLAFITILFSASGLFALISLKILEREKEIGIRKVMGASLGELLKIMSNELMIITVIAFVIGSSLGFLLVKKVVFSFIFAYHSPIGIGAFVATLAIMTLATVCTVGLKVYRSAMANPINALRDE